MTKSDLENIETLQLSLREKEVDLLEKQEELESQREMLSAAINELALKNKNLEETLVKLNELNVELRQLLYQSSHGLRSPLTSIQGVSNLMGLEPMSNTMREYKGHVDFKIAAMLEILNSLTTLAALDSSDVNSDLVNIHTIISSCAHYLSPLALQNNTVIEVPHEIAINDFRSDPVLITAILKQVVMNGIIFRDNQKQGYVRITASTSGENKDLIIIVEDDGEGIAPGVSNNIFNMFVRGSGKSGGSGLGLFIAKKAVDLLNGSIHFIREDGKTKCIVAIHVDG